MGEIPFGRPWIDDDDRRAVARVLEGPVLAHGPEGKAFESDFAAFMGEGARCVSTSSCMAALHLAYLALKIGPGDEVVVPAQTHTATAHAVEWVGARPVFADCDPATGNVTARTIAARLTPRTKAVSVVHFLGIPCDMPPIVDLVRSRGLSLVEDCALAVGARHDGRHVGLFGDAGCFSFYPVKHLTTAEGGMLATTRPDLAEAVSKLRAFGVDRPHGERVVPGMYDVPSLGLNYRMSELQAALGRTQLAKVARNLELRRRNFERLAASLRQRGRHVLDSTSAACRSSHYCLSVVLADHDAAARDALALGLKSAGIGTSIYYPHPVPRLAYYRGKYGYDPALYPEATTISDRSLALPTGPHLSEEDVLQVAVAVGRALEKSER